jgi:hypothetical protein
MLDEGQTFYTLNPDAVLECFDDGALVLRVEDSNIFELNSTARDILMRTEGQNTLGEVAAFLAQDYGISEEDAFQDVNDLCKQLLAQNILQEKSKRV